MNITILSYITDFLDISSVSPFTRNDSSKRESLRSVNNTELLFQSSQSPELRTQTVEEDVECDSSDSNNFKDEVEDHMVCWVNYFARSPGEIDLNFSQRVRVLSISLEWCFVRNLATLQCGYVPTGSLMKIEPFLTQLLEITQDDVFV